MRKIALALFLSVVALSVVACGPGLKAPKLADGSKVVVAMLVDGGVTADTDAEKAKQLNEVTARLSGDLTSRFTKNEYQVETVAAEDQFTPGPNKFLLKVKVLSYNPGNKGARVAGALIGGWTGAAMGNAAEARLAASYVLNSETAKIAGGDLNEGSGTSDWPYAVARVNTLIMQRAAKAIQAQYATKK